VESCENPSRLAAKNIKPHQEAGYTSAVVTINRQPANLLQSGGVHIHPDIAVPLALWCSLKAQFMTIEPSLW
jgi:hypothetical protein